MREVEPRLEQLGARRLELRQRLGHAGLRLELLGAELAGGLVLQLALGQGRRHLAHLALAVAQIEPRQHRTGVDQRAFGTGTSTTRPLVSALSSTARTGAVCPLTTISGAIGRAALSTTRTVMRRATGSADAIGAAGAAAPADAGSGRRRASRRAAA